MMAIGILAQLLEVPLALEFLLWNFIIPSEVAFNTLQLSHANESLVQALQAAVQRLEGYVRGLEDKVEASTKK
jgi:hypothetical protein